MMYSTIFLECMRCNTMVRLFSYTSESHITVGDGDTIERFLKKHTGHIDPSMTNLGFNLEWQDEELIHCPVDAAIQAMETRTRQNVEDLKMSDENNVIKMDPEGKEEKPIPAEDQVLVLTRLLKLANNQNVEYEKVIQDQHDAMKLAGDQFFQTVVVHAAARHIGNSIDMDAINSTLNEPARRIADKLGEFMKGD